METMKAIVIYEAGGPEKLLLEERPIPQLQEGWTLVKVRGFGINHSEIFTREGLSSSVTFPRILGIECVGRDDSRRFRDWPESGFHHGRNGASF